MPNPPRTLPRRVAAAITLIVWALLRVVLWLGTGPSLAGWGNAPRLFTLGLWFDLATLAFTVSQWLLASALLPGRWSDARAIRALRWIVLWLAVALLLFGAVAEFTFWQEFSTRFNFIAVDYLVYTQEVIGNIRQSYPVPAIVAAIAAAALAIVFLVRRYVRLSAAPLGTRRRVVLVALAIALPAISIAVANLDQMNGSGNAYADELAGNGLFSRGFRRKLDYDQFYRTMPQATPTRSAWSVSNACPIRCAEARRDGGSGRVGSVRADRATSCSLGRASPPSSRRGGNRAGRRRT
jgi:hypothetical protein